VGRPVFNYDKYCRGAKDFFTLSREIISGQIGITQPVTMKKVSKQFKKVASEKLKEFSGITFSVQAPRANSVFIVGDFNNWSLDDNYKLQKVNGIWMKRLSLDKGSHQYRFVVDGQWLEDPHNPQTIVNPYGELNSIINVE
jgi:1,4-alpha-glucan branching enzyme